MGNLEKISIILFIIMSLILIIFFCPVTVTVQKVTTTSNMSTYYTPGKFSPNVSTYHDTNNTSYTYEDNRFIWDLDTKSSSSSTTTTLPGVPNTQTYESPTINFAKLLLEEICILSIIFVLYLIAKRFVIIWNIEGYKPSIIFSNAV